MARPQGVLRGIPARLKIGYAEWRVALVKRGTLDEAQGLCDPDTMTITLERGRGQQQTINTTIHELLHALWHAADLPEECPEEQAVTLLAHGLQQALRDNPGLGVWWSRHVCKLAE